MKKVLLSLLTVGVVGGTATFATLAYFSSSHQVQGNAISTGTMDFQGIIQDVNGSYDGVSGTFSVLDLAPGETFTRCLWIKNTGTVPGRYKIYASAESGDVAEVGNFLKISATLNPTAGDDCADNDNPFNPDGTVYGPPNTQKAAWIDVPARGSFFGSDTTPFKIESSEDAMPGGFYALFRIDVELDSSATEQDKSYTQDITIYGLQDAGSGPSSGW